jgi:hypothetical protein
MTTRANLYVDQGTDFLVSLELETDDGEKYPASSLQFFCQVRKMYSSSVLLEADLEVITNGTSNEVNLSFSPGDTRDLKPGKYQYDLVVIDDTNKTKKILEGLLFIIPTITRLGSSTDES